MVFSCWLLPFRHPYLACSPSVLFRHSHRAAWKCIQFDYSPRIHTTTLQTHTTATVIMYASYSLHHISMPKTSAGHAHIETHRIINAYRHRESAENNCLGRTKTAHRIEREASKTKIEKQKNVLNRIHHRQQNANGKEYGANFHFTVIFLILVFVVVRHENENEKMEWKK